MVIAKQPSSPQILQATGLLSSSSHPRLPDESQLGVIAPFISVSEHHKTPKACAGTIPVAIQSTSIKPRDILIKPDPQYRSVKSWDMSPTPSQLLVSSPIAEYPETPKVKFQLPKTKIISAPSQGLQPTIASSTPPPPKQKLSLPSSIALTADAKPALTSAQLEIQTSNNYVIPTTFDPYKYGRPSTSRPVPSEKTVGRGDEPIYGYPTAERRGPALEPRTIVIKGLPSDPSLAMVSLICRNSGKIETITLFETLRKARVSFVNSTDAQNFFNSSGNGVNFEYEVQGKKIKHKVSVHMSHDIDFLSAQTHTLVNKQGASRVVRIVGWDREGLEYLVDAEQDEESYESLLVKLAGMYAYKAVDDRVEGATWRKNEKGYMEACLLYSRIKDACCALPPLMKEVELSRCNITYGKDP